MYFQCWKSTRRRDKLLILWTLFSIQLLLIAFVLFGSNSNNLTDDIGDDSLQANRFNSLPHPKIQRVVKFLNNDISLPTAAVTSTLTPLKIVLPALDTFQNAYFDCRNGKPANFSADSLFCFRHGSVQPINPSLRQMTDASEDEYDGCICKCQAGFHGTTCNQPETVWRAFMAAHLLKRLNNDDQLSKTTEMNEPKPRRIFYHIDSSTLSLTTIEIQINELHDLVDLFIFCDEIRNKTTAVHGVSSKHERFRYHQQSTEHGSNFVLKKYKAKILIVETRHKCTPKATYKLFRSRMDVLHGDEIYMYSAYDEILNRQAVQYIKWNDNWLQSQPIRFRLKYTVYGFYWQHPMQTILSSAACQLHVLDEHYKKDPIAVLNATGMIIGDLNHYGGWFCQYCYDSTQHIAQKVQRDRMLNATGVSVFSSLVSNHFDKNTNDIVAVDGVRHSLSHMDASHIESLISAGVYVDGKLDLIRLHRYSDKYFAPDTVSENSQNYEPLLTNTYAHYDGDTEE